MKTCGIGERDYVNVCGRGIGRVRGPPCLPPFSTPSLQTELYFKQLEEGRRGATETRKKKAPKKGGGVAGPFTGAVV